jgi:hypothetical protein
MKGSTLLIALMALVLGAVLAGCEKETERKQTALTIDVSTTGGSRSFELRCDPPGGTAPNPAQLCASLAAHARDILFHAVPPNFGLTQIYIGGEYQGQVIENHAGTFPASWWSALIPAAVATPDAVPVVREPRTFKIIPPRAPNRPAGVVAWPSTLAQAGDIVVCIVDGKRFRAFVPEPGHGVAGIADPAPGGTAVTVAVTNDGGVVTARCVAEV